MEETRDFSIRPPADYVPYAARKPYVVADSMEDLRGPTSGTVTLPRHLDWSGSPTYELVTPGRPAVMYETVLNEAASVDDLITWLDRRLLVELWPTLWLPPRLRQLWQDRFPELAAHRTAAA